jgi:hypothetical protein
MSNDTFLIDDREYRTDIFQAIEHRLNYMMARFSRTYVVRLDITFPQGYIPTGTNEECSELMRRLKEHYTYHGVVMHYVGVREQKTSDNPHYHIVIFFDGAKQDNGWTVFLRAAAIWSRVLGLSVDGYVHLCQPNGANGIKIAKPRIRSVGMELQNERAAFHAAVNAAMAWLVYLAKTATKGDAPFHTRKFFCSQLSPRLDQPA